MCTIQLKQSLETGKVYNRKSTLLPLKATRKVNLTQGKQKRKASAPSTEIEKKQTTESPSKLNVVPFERSLEMWLKKDINHQY